MTFNFDEIIPRKGTGCVKWDEEAPRQTGDQPLPADKDIIPLWVADMDFAVAPAIQEAIRRRAQHPVFGYTHVQDDYYEAVIAWFKRRHGWSIAREHILYTTGVVPAMSCAIKALTMPGERVLILSPDYNCFFSSIRNNGCEVAECVLRLASRATEKAPPFSRATDCASQFGCDAEYAPRSPRNAECASQFGCDARFEVDWPAFEALCADEKTTLFLLCNPHNPTGRVWTREELQRMSDTCRHHHVRIVSDEIHCELVMPGHTFCPMGTVDADAIILNSPSKAFNIAGLQMANIVCTDAATRRRLDRAININEVCDVNPFGPVAVKAAYNESEEWLEQLNAYLWDNYRFLCSFAEKEMPQWKVMPMEGTYLAWVDCSACCDDIATYCDRLLKEAGVWVNPGTMYGKQSGKGYLRINLACPRKVLMEAMERIRKLN